MQTLLSELQQRWADKGISTSTPVVRDGSEVVSLDDIAAHGTEAVDGIPQNSVVAHIGDFSSADIAILLGLIDRKCVIAPLTTATSLQHEYFFETIGAQWIIENGVPREVTSAPEQHELIDQLRENDAAGLILFSSGTTGKPKAALHDWSRILNKFRAYTRPALRTMAFLQFDHIGGLNTLFHTLYNAGTVHVPVSTRPGPVIEQIANENIELLPTTPSFLRLAMMEGAFEDADLSNLKMVTYGTERMEQGTLDRLNKQLPDNVDIRQTYGMSELGIFPVRNKSRHELWIRLADPTIELEIREDVLWVKSPHRMLGYLNAPSPFDDDGFYNTRDTVETSDEFFCIIGRTDEIINIGGIKVYPGEVEDAACDVQGVVYARAGGEPDPILGEHIRLTVQLEEGLKLSRREFRRELSQRLNRDRMPHKIEFGEVELTTRFKKR